MTNKTLALVLCLVSATALASGTRKTRHSLHGAKVHSSTGKVEINIPVSSVRVAPVLGSRVLGTADFGSEATILSVTPAYARLRFITGLTGWVARKELAPARVEPTDEVLETRVLAREMDPAAEKIAGSGNSRTKLLTRAAAFRGVRYVWGAASRSGTDCSGFTTQVYRAVGVKLPRVSWAQAGVGKAVSRAQVAPGDLVFFRTRGGGRVSHVGIYVGANQFIHASSGSGKVRYSSLGESYYAKRYAGARRVLPLGTKVQADSIVREAKKHENETWTTPIGEIDGGSGEIAP